MMVKEKDVIGWEAEGYLTVYLSLILSVMLSLCLVLITGVRENTRRLEIECVTDIGMDSILAEYHRELLRQYDLFFIDTSYGTEEPSYEQTAQHLKQYVEMNLGGEGIFLENWYRTLLNLQVDSVEITGVSVASDDDGAVLRRQAIECMESRIGISLLKQVENWVTVTKDYELDTKDVLAEQREATKKLEAWNGTEVTVDGEEGIAVVESPGKTVVSYWDAGMLSLVVKEPDKLSTAAMQAENYISSRQVNVGTGLGPEYEFEDNFWDQLLFHEYILEYTGRFGDEKEEGFLKYQTEYILSGQESDLGNLTNVVYVLLAVRAASNMVYLVTDAEKMEFAETAAGTLASLILLPELTPLFQAVIVLTWALAESIYDVAQLLDGSAVPLLKEKGDWHYGLDQTLAFGGDVAGSKNEKGLFYEDYLRILLCLQDRKTTTFRLMDIMEMDIRQTQGNCYFRMDGCIDSVTAQIQYSSKEERTYSITRSYSY